MPMYQYKCPECGAELETLQKVGAPAPQCSTEGCVGHKKPMQKKVSRSSFILQGGGWAKDGYSS